MLYKLILSIRNSSSFFLNTALIEYINSNSFNDIGAVFVQNKELIVKNEMLETSLKETKESKAYLQNLISTLLPAAIDKQEIHNTLIVEEPNIFGGKQQFSDSIKNKW